MMRLSKQLCIDLGTANTRLFDRGIGIVFDESTIVAISETDHKVLAVGKKAKEMVGRTSGDVVVVRPMKHGVIADYAVTEALLRYLLRVSLGRFFPLKPEVMIAVPSGSTQVERRAMLDALISSGAKTAYLVDESLAAIIGAGVSIAETSGNMVLNIGAGNSECAVISMGGVVASNSVRVGGNTFDDTVRSYLKKQYGLIVGTGTAEAIKRRIGSAIEVESNPAVIVRGRDSAQGTPKEITVHSKEIFTCFVKTQQQIVTMVKKVLSNIPPELSSDLLDKGIILTGGGSLLSGLDIYLSEEIGVPVVLAEQPMTCVVSGMDKIFDHIEQYKRTLEFRT